MPVPTPKSGQSKNQYMDTCMHEVSKNSDKDQDQRVAICLGTWAKANEEDAILDKFDLFLTEEKACPEGEKY
jgi:hypothetical protein